MQGSFEKRLAVALVFLLCLSSCKTSSRPGEEAGRRFAEIYTTLGRADDRVNEGDYRDALELYQRALIEIEEISDALPAWKPDYVAYKRKECVDKMERAVARLGPQEQEKLKAQNIYLRAVESLQKEEVEDALAKLKKALEVYPGFFDAQWMVGNAYERLRDPDRALAAYKKACEIDPSSPLPHQSMGELYEGMGKYNDALDEFKKAIQADPGNVAPYIYSSWVYINIGELEEALAVSRKALEIDPDNKVIHNNIGLIYQKMEKFDKAADEYKRAILEDHKYISPYQNLGLVYGLQGRYAESIDQYKQVLELDPKDAAAHFNIGINYKRLRKKLLARYHLEQAARLYGYDTDDGKKVQEKLEELDSPDADLIITGPYDRSG